MRTISNHRRGCGHLVSGGMYARGDMGPGGRLAPWTWCLGHMIEGLHNVLLTVPPRSMQIINLPATLALGRAVTEPEPVAEEQDFPALKRLPRIALLDHIGSDNYTPFSFAHECTANGPSRRIPPEVARQVATFAPLPILFTHTWLPCPDEATALDLEDWCHISRDEREAAWRVPTFARDDWGMQAKDRNGGQHWMTPVMRVMHEAAGGQCMAQHKLFPDQPLRDMLFAEQALGLSWITSVVYVKTGKDSDEELNALRNMGIEPVEAGVEQP